MDFIERIEKVIKSGILSKNLSDFASYGATDEMIVNEEKKLHRKLSNLHKHFLKRWNGSNLDYIRVYGVNQTENEFIKELAEENQEWYDEITSEIDGNPIMFADDAGGSMYFEFEDGTIGMLDSDGWELTIVASDMRDFFLNYLYGERANEFMGGDWVQELKDAKVI